MENGIKLRDYQERIIEKAIKALDSGHSVVINAPTGTGKTMMALEVLRRLEKTGWIYVRTISQYSSWERDARKLSLSFTGLMRKGEFCKVLKKPYILYCSQCDKEVDVDHVRVHKKFVERRYINPICYDHNALDRFSAYCPFRLERVARELEDEDAPEFISEVVGKMNELLNTLGIKSTANWFRDNKVSFRGSNYDVCIYKLIEGKANIRIYSYIYFFLGIRRPENDDNDSIIIFDEAHNLDDFNINSVTITLKEVLGFFSRIEGIKQEQVQEAFIKFVQDPEGGFEFMNLLVQANEELARKFSTIMQAWKEQEKWYIERDTAMWSYIKAMPADPAIWLSRLNNYRYILLSGTMPSGDYLRTVWGLTNFEYINAMYLWSSTSLKDHFKGARVFIEDSIYYIKDKRPEYRRQVAEIIKQYSAKEGLNLVIVPSYNELEAYRSLFPNAFFEDLRPDVLDRVKKLPNGFIIFAVAGGKLSEGIEVLDSNGRSRISAVFIIGLPLPEYKDPYLDKVIEVVSKRVGRNPESFKWVVLYEKAVIKVKQAIGRAIRGPHDSANIYLIDKRFGYKNVMKLMNLEVA